MRLVLVLVFTYVSSWAAPAGYLSIETDQETTEVYVDSRFELVPKEGVVVAVSPGRHFVSLFPPRKVYQAFRDETPEQFWDEMRRAGTISESRRLLSSYERGAVREGTKWVYAASDDTIPVRLSAKKALERYNQDSSCVLNTLLGWTVLVGIGMAVSLALAKLD
ncbi:MAG: hypothetical protein ABIL25_09110 [candidate division WOR-3 bacterium]